MNDSGAVSVSIIDAKVVTGRFINFKGLTSSEPIKHSPCLPVMKKKKTV